MSFASDDSGGDGVGGWLRERERERVTAKANSLNFVIKLKFIRKDFFASFHFFCQCLMAAASVVVKWLKQIYSRTLHMHKMVSNSFFSFYYVSRRSPLPERGKSNKNETAELSNIFPCLKNAYKMATNLLFFVCYCKNAASSLSTFYSIHFNQSEMA